MKVFISGSRRELESARFPEFESAARQLGYELALRNHKPVLLSEKDNTFDYPLVGGLEDYAKESGKKPTIETHRTIDSPIYAGRNDINVETVEYRPGNRRDVLLARRVGAILASDVVLLVGGSNGTKRVGELALATKRPLLAAAGFGGKAAELFSEIQQMYLQREDLKGRLQCLRETWRTRKQVEDMVSLLELFGGRHAYFLSYSHTDMKIADHVEVLLRRFGREVVRDEATLSPNEELKPRLASIIRASDTFLLLWSKSSSNSDWCQWELNCALSANQESNIPRRVVLLLRDSTAIPKNLRSVLHPNGRRRSNRTLSVTELVNGETR